MIRTAFAAAIAAVMFACIAAPSHAAPIAPLPSGVATAQTDHATDVGCRRYRRNGVWGCW
jgi:hypothetical protein